MSTQILKFRAYWKGVNKMVYFGFGTFTYAKTGENGLFFPSKDGIYMGNALVMQYTGFKDSNDADIYEGDILNISNYQSSGKDKRTSVIWWQSYGCWAAQHIKKSFLTAEDWGHEGLEHCLRWKSEVVGNIYDNPELLPDEV